VWRGLVTASYEVDLFGRVAASVDAARNDYAAEMASLRSVLLALQADVAQAYYALREADEELRLLRETVALREESVRLLERRHQLGDIGELDLARAQTELAVAQSDATALERSRAQIEHGLAILLGKAPAAFEIAPAPLPDAVPAVPAGLPSELLERRPDIAAAQRAMAAANARIGVARSAFFPALRLTAQGGFESAELADLFQWSSRTWVLGPLIGTILTLPLIDGGRNQANLERSYAVLEEAVADYRGRVLGAFGEVEDRLVSLRTLAEQRAATHRAVDSATRALRIATARYDAGASSYLDVIDAQRSLLAMQRLDTRIRGERAVATVALIRALGGGWSMQAGDAVGMTR
jgi:multidrug efflux system outer membrane protein